MFVPFLFELRRRGVQVGPSETLSLARALSLGLHGSTLDGFYAVARSLCVHREEDLDAFDRAFAHHFRGVADEALELTEELLSWLREPKAKRPLTDEERALLESLDLDEARRRLQERLREQRERHDGGNRWVGTGGTSPHGAGGTHPSGIRVGERGGGRSAMEIAAQRKFRALRGDVALDTRGIELVLRRLRAFVREGAPEELDVEGSIDATAKNAGELELRLRPRRRSNLRVLLLLDVGGSMDPHAELSEKLFSAARRATHLKELRTFFFHNCVYGKLYDSASLVHGVDVRQVLREYDREVRLIVVGDALMSPWELHAGAGNESGWGTDSGAPGAAWLSLLASHFARTAWLNPEPELAWTGTAALIGRIFPMYRLTLDGLLAAVQHLVRGAARR